MDHETASELFSDYLEGQLPAEQARELEAHLADCPSCRQELDDLRSTLRSLAILPAQRPPEGLARDVQQRIRRRSRGRFFSPERILTRLPFEWISFVIILIMLVLYYMLVQAQVTGVAPAPPHGSSARSSEALLPDGPVTGTIDARPRCPRRKK